MHDLYTYFVHIKSMCAPKQWERIAEQTFHIVSPLHCGPRMIRSRKNRLRSCAGSSGKKNIEKIQFTFKAEEQSRTQGIQEYLWKYVRRRRRQPRHRYRRSILKMMFVYSVWNFIHSYSFSIEILSLWPIRAHSTPSLNLQQFLMCAGPMRTRVLTDSSDRLSFYTKFPILHGTHYVIWLRQSY